MRCLVEGIDRSGKDSSLIEFDKLTKWATSNSMRGSGVGNIVYDKMYNRLTPERLAEYEEVVMANKACKHFVVFFYASKDVIAERLKQENNGVLDWNKFCTPDWSYEKLIDEYRVTLYKYYTPEEVLEIDTSDKTAKDSAQIMFEKYNEVLKSDFQFTIDRQSRDIKSPNGSYKYTQYEPLTRFFTKSKLDLLPPFDISVDKPYYEMVEYTLKHILLEYEMKWKNERQLVYTSSDCIPYIQLKIEDNKVVYFVSQRSFDYAKHKTNDLMFFYDFHKKNFTNRDITIIYNCAFPHTYE